MRGVKGTYKTYECKNCGQTSKWGPSKKNIYCSVRCQWEDKQKQILDEWLRGDYTNKTGKFPDVALTHVAECQGYACGICGIKEHNGKDIGPILQADYIDGNSSNLQPDNLRLLCPNCHCQTETWGRKGTSKGERKRDYRNEYRRRQYNERKRTSENHS